MSMSGLVTDDLAEDYDVEEDLFVQEELDFEDENAYDEDYVMDVAADGLEPFLHADFDDTVLTEASADDRTVGSFSDDDFNTEWTGGASESVGWLRHGRSRFSNAIHCSGCYQNLDVMDLWKSPEGHWELASVASSTLSERRKLVKIIRLKSPAEQADDSIVETFLGELEFDLCHVKSIARSADGSTLAVGGKEFVDLVRVDPEQKTALQLICQIKFATPRQTDDSANNCYKSVRFMIVGDEEYLLMARLDYGVVVIPNRWPLLEASRGAGSRLFEEFCWASVGTVTACSSDDEEQKLAFRALGFDCSVAQPSLCGNYIAVLHNHGSPRVLLREERFTNLGGFGKTLSYFPETEQGGTEVKEWYYEAYATGRLNCCWSPQSDILAVNAPHMRCIYLWGVPEFHQLMTIRMCGRPMRSMAFSPCQPGLMALCQAQKAFLLDVNAELEQLRAAEQAKELIESELLPDCSEETEDVEGRRFGSCCFGTAVSPVASHAEPWVPALTVQAITRFQNLQQSADGPGPASGRRLSKLYGVGFTDDDRLLLSSWEGVAEFPVLSSWSCATHKYFPAKFKEAVKTLLLCAKSSSDDSQGFGIQHLPEALLYKISQQLAAHKALYFPQYKNYIPLGLSLKE